MATTTNTSPTGRQLITTKSIKYKLYKLRLIYSVGRTWGGEREVISVWLFSALPGWWLLVLWPKCKCLLHICRNQKHWRRQRWDDDDDNILCRRMGTGAQHCELRHRVTVWCERAIWISTPSVANDYKRMNSDGQTDRQTLDPCLPHKHRS